MSIARLAERIEFVQSTLFEAGEVIALGNDRFLEIVEDIEHADGVICLGHVAEASAVGGAGVMVSYFTFYCRQPRCDLVDHEATIHALQAMDPSTVHDIASSVHDAILYTSMAAGLCFLPDISFFETESATL